MNNELHIMLNEASQWRLAIARNIAPLIATNPDVRAIMLAGSTSRGCADSYSDIEIGVFWDIPPTDTARLAPVGPAGGEFWELDDYNEADQVWMEEWGLGGLKVDVRNLTVARMEGILDDVLLRHATDSFQQATASAVLYAIPLYNAPLLERWQARLAEYPPGLARAMVQAHWRLDEWVWWMRQLIDRGDWPLVAQSLSEAVGEMLGMLFGLNHIYHPGLKWMDRSIKEMHVVPHDFATRIEAVFHSESSIAVQVTRELVLEVYDLLARHLPELDVSMPRTRFLRWRQQFDAPPSFG